MSIDPTIIATAAGVIRGTVATISELQKLLKDGKAKPQQVNDLILRIQSSLSDAQAGLLQSQQQIATLTAENSTLRRELDNLRDVKENYDFRDNMCWRRGTGEGPFCPTCLQDDHKAVNLIDCSSHFECRVHKQVYLTRAQREDASRPIKRGLPIV